MLSLAAIKAETGAVSVDYKSMADELMREMHESSQRVTNLFSGETAVQPGKDFPMAFAKRKARKHYKPNFTL